MPVPFWLICFSDTIKGPMRQMFFVVLLPDGTLLCRGWRSGCERVHSWPFPLLEEFLFFFLSKVEPQTAGTFVSFESNLEKNY
jgi:hypothetical protein